jgi:hypothetical protein
LSKCVKWHQNIRDDATTTIRVIDDSPLAAGLVGQAYEDSLIRKTVKSNVVVRQQIHVLVKKVVVVVMLRQSKASAKAIISVV